MTLIGVSMKLIFTGLSILFFQYAHAYSCQCKTILTKNFNYNETLASPVACLTNLREMSKMNFYQKSICGNGQDIFSFKWQCDNGVQTARFSCKQLEREAVEDSVESIFQFGFVDDIIDNVLGPKKDDCIKNDVLATLALDDSTQKSNKDALRLKFKNEAELDDFLAKNISKDFLARPKDGLEFILNLPNDNKGLGLLDVLMGDHGNDVGNTHGFLFSVSKGFDGDFHITISHESNLYTKRTGDSNIVDGVKIRDQLFLEDNFTQIVWDNRAKIDPEYYSVGLGWHRINQDDVGNPLFSSVGQQKSWHENVLGPEIAPQYNYIPNKEGSSSGVFMKASAGTDLDFSVTKIKDLSMSSEVGLAVSSADEEYNHLFNKTEVNYDAYKGESTTVRLTAGVEGQYYIKPDNSSFKAKIAVEYGGEDFSCGLALKKYLFGAGADYLQYDTDADDMITDIQCKYRLAN